MFWRLWENFLKMWLSKTPLDISIIYYTSNHLDTQNPIFVENTRKHLLKVVGDHPLISVSQKPMNFGQNICMGDIGRSHLNIYRQILAGCKAATSKYVAMAEDDILYSYNHFHTTVPKDDVFLFDMNRWSIFTWTKPPMFSYRTKRRVVNQLIAPRKLWIEALEERFERAEFLMKQGKSEAEVIHYWGDPGRYEALLGVTVRKTADFYCNLPSIVFTHPKAFGYESNHGNRKRLGDLKAIELVDIGRAEDIVRFYYEPKEL